MLLLQRVAFLFILNIICSGNCQRNSNNVFPILRLVAVRQIEVSSPQTSGILEFEQKGRWYRFCNEGWTERESYVACGQLGFPNTVSKEQRASYGFDSSIRIKNVKCEGHESWITQCEHESATIRNYCYSGRPVVVSCLQPTSTPTFGIRLKAGAFTGEGRVQILSGSRWMSICGNGWHLKTANVACRQLGFGTGRESFTGTKFGQGHGKIWISNVTCNGDEKNLNKCAYNNVDADESCSHNNVAGVSCFVPDVNHGKKIRIIDGFDERSGRIAVQVKEGVWGSICSDHWTLSEASVACRQLGLGFALGAIQDVWYWTASSEHLETVMTKVRCKGNENALSECDYQTNSNTYFLNCGTRLRFTTEYVGVSCVQALPDLHLDVGALQESFTLDIIPLQELECAVSENCFAPSAYDPSNAASLRNLLRFTTSIWNRGTADFSPWQSPSEWQYHECHQHYHSMEEFLHYDILSTDTHQRVAEGHKVSFCLADTICDSGISPRYNCSNISQNPIQAISVGCADIYYLYYDCQWIDLTDVSSGTYVVKITINPLELVSESDFDNNEVICEMEYTGLSASVRNCRVPDDLM
ncbi:unnamed protein product [Clavelina lepadiformis]|uniref:SRCR domain-containing protein n=2 Tax=Clavelina lepadiformis TaxID=159417 RepID=A0ABP0GYJ4_CLALP